MGNKENEITRSVLVKKRLREVMIGEVAKTQKITAQLRIAQKRSRKYIHHGYEQIKAIKKMQNKLRRLRRNVMEQNVKQRQAMSRAAKLDKIIIARAALLRRVQAEHAHVVAAFRRRRAERAMLTFKQRSLRGSSIEALHVHKALAGTIRRIRALERKLKNLKGLRTTRKEEKMRQRIISEIMEEKLVMSNSMMELRRVGRRIKNLMNELRNIALRSANMRQEKRELKHHMAREREMIIALRNARMRMGGLLARVGTEDAREIKNFKYGKRQAMRAGHRKTWRSESSFIAKQRKRLQKLKTVQRRYLLELSHIKKQQSILLILLQRKKVSASHALQHVLQKRTQWLKEIRKRANTLTSTMTYLSRKLQNKERNAIKKMRMTNSRGSRRFRKMILHERQNLSEATIKESYLVFKLRKAWLKLHKALRRCRRTMKINAILRQSGEVRRTQRLAKETRRLTMFLNKEEEENRLLLKRHRLWTSEIMRKWRVRLTNTMKRAHEVITALDLEIKRAKVEKNREKKGRGRYKDWLENIEHHINALRKEKVLLTRMMDTTAGEIEKKMTPMVMLRTASTRLKKISMQKLADNERAKLIKSVRAEQNNRREALKKGSGEM